MAAECGEVSATPGDQANIQPTLFIHERCGRLIETLPALQHDQSRPEDVLKVDADEEGVGGDDAADALRYLVAMKSREVRGYPNELPGVSPVMLASAVAAVVGILPSL